MDIEIEKKPEEEVVDPLEEDDDFCDFGPPGLFLVFFRG
jgi:hypothetical protein